jgi:hypothetical protein
MSAIQAKEAERTRDEPDGRAHACAPPANHTGDGDEGRQLRHGRRKMRVRLCARCPYTPQDLAGHYDPNGALHVCAKCDGKQEASTNHYPRKTPRRQTCATVLNTFGTTQQSVAPSVPENLASSVTTPGEPPSVQRSALIASKPAGKATADGYGCFRPPDSSCSEKHAKISRRSGFRSKEAAP